MTFEQVNVVGIYNILACIQQNLYESSRLGRCTTAAASTKTKMEEWQSPSKSVAADSDFQSEISQSQGPLWAAVEETLDQIFAKHSFLVDGLEDMITPAHQPLYAQYLLQAMPPNKKQVTNTNFPISNSELEPLILHIHLANLAWKPKHNIRMPAGRDRVQELLPHIKSGYDDGKFVFASDPLRLRTPTGAIHDIDLFELEADKGQCFFHWDILLLNFNTACSSRDFLGGFSIPCRLPPHFLDACYCIHSLSERHQVIPIFWTGSFHESDSVLESVS